MRTHPPRWRGRFWRSIWFQDRWQCQRLSRRSELCLYWNRQYRSVSTDALVYESIFHVQNIEFLPNIRVFLCLCSTFNALSIVQLSQAVVVRKRRAPEISACFNTASTWSRPPDYSRGTKGGATTLDAERSLAKSRATDALQPWWWLLCSLKDDR